MSNRAVSLLVVMVIVGATVALTLPPSPLYYKTILSGSSCATPLAYYIATVDPRFGVSEEYVANALSDAERLWERGALSDLFVATDDKGIPVSLVFDNRQQETYRLQSMMDGIEDGSGQYEIATAEYARMEEEYRMARASYVAMVERYQQDYSQYEEEVEQYNTAQAEYQQEVDQWNRRGGAPSDVYEQLNKQQEELSDWYDALSNQTEALQKQQQAVERERMDIAERIHQLNEVAEWINVLIGSLNLKIQDYTIIQEERDEFVTGTYEHSAYAKSITVYQFEDYEELVLVLAHEMGHALGVDHVQNPVAIMYPFIGEQEEFLTPDDVSALRLVCPSLGGGIQ